MIRDDEMAESRAQIERILAGDTQAFTEFVTQYQRLVSHIVFRMVKNESDREDLCQDVFLAVYQNLSGFRFESKMSTWVARVAYYRCLSHLEKMKTPAWSDVAAEDQSLDTVAGDHQTPDEYTERQDVSKRVRAEIDDLPAHFRTILTLYHLEEMSYQEIGDIMDLPEGTVKSYLFRARKLLKKRLLARYGSEEPWQ